MQGKERTSRNAPCIFCGDVGYDMRIHYEDGLHEEVVHYCHKTSAAKGEKRVVGTETYICIAAGKVLPVVGAFDLWKKYLSKEEWMQNQKGEGVSKPSIQSYAASQEGRISSILLGEEKNRNLLPGEVKARSPKEQHEFYTYLASLLVLEEKHKKTLEEEWESGCFKGVAGKILSRYPIRSIPPIDKSRIAGKEVFQNITRKKLVEALVAQFGDLSGYPIMYLRSGAYWDQRPEAERWTFACGEGILFPCFDKDGFLKYRIKNDYPDIKLKEEIHDSFRGMYGRFHHFYDKDGFHCWSFIKKGDANATPVYGPGVTNPILLNAKGLPLLGGKPEGKYTNISSVFERRMPDGKVVNAFYKGSRSGAAYSIYYQKEEPFTVVIGTEGEKKSMVTNLLKKCPVVCVPGVSAFSVLFDKDSTGRSAMDFLKEKGMKYFILCYDADKEENERVLAAEAAFVNALREEGITPLIGEWKGKFDKGIDDILLKGLDISVRKG